MMWWTYDDLSGRTFGKLLVVKRTEDHVLPSGKHKTRFLCRCSCGKEVKILRQDLISGKRKSCGHLREEKKKNRRTRMIKNLRGQRFGDLEVVGLSDKCYANGHRLWLVQCGRCGKLDYAAAHKLTSGEKTCCAECGKEHQRAQAEKARAAMKEYRKEEAARQERNAAKFKDCCFDEGTRCKILREMLCRTKGKCGFYKSSLENSTQE